MPRPSTPGFATAEERNGWIVHWLSNGLPAARMAELLGLSVSTVRTYAWRGAVARGMNRQQKLGPFPDKRSRDIWIWTQWQWGTPQVTIARTLGIARQLVWRTVRFMNALDNAAEVCSQAEVAHARH